MSQLSIKNKCQAFPELPQTHRSKYDFAYNFRPIYIVSRVFGLMPFSFTYQANGEIDKPTVTKLDGFWFSISMCTYSFGIYTLSQLIFPRSNIYISPLVIFSDNMTVILGLILGFFAVGFDMYNRTKLVGIVKRIIAFDKKVWKFWIFSKKNLRIK